MTDNVNQPAHYNQGEIECIQAIEASMTPTEFQGYLKGNVIKYTWRYRYKGGVEDLQKATWYLARLIAAVGATPTPVKNPEFATRQAVPVLDPNPCDRVNCKVCKVLYGEDKS